jgi:hypothetical protein
MAIVGEIGIIAAVVVLAGFFTYLAIEQRREAPIRRKMLAEYEAMQKERKRTGSTFR